MNRLSKTDAKKKDGYFAELEKARDAVNEAVAKYNEVVGIIEEFRQEVYDRQEEYSGNKSDAWQEGERGTAYGEWKDEWGTTIDVIEEPEMDALDQFEGLRNSPDE